MEPSRELIAEMRLLELAMEAQNRGILKKVNNRLDELKRSMREGLFEPSFASAPMFHRVKILGAVMQGLDEDDYIAKEIERHLFDYAWVGSDYPVIKPLKRTDILEKVARFLIEHDPEIQLRELSMHTDRLRSIRNKTLEYCYERNEDFKEEYKPCADLISVNATVRFDRRVTFTQLQHYTRALLDRVVEIYNEQHPEEPIKAEQIYSALLDEILDFLRTGRKFDRDRLEARSDFWVCEIREGVVDEKVGEAARHYTETLIQQGEVGHFPLHPEFPLEGIPRVRGSTRTIRGPARIVVTSEDLEKIQTGDILVTLMAMPSHREYFGKIQGVITEEGTMTCHALTLAQEVAWRFGIVPIVTDVAWAAEILRDDDLIEVDTFSGQISLLERS